MADNHDDVEKSHGSNSSSSSSSGSIEVPDPIPEEESARLLVAFRPLLDLLLVTNDAANDGDKLKDEKQLVHFLWTQGVTSLEDWKKLDECSVQWDTEEQFPVFSKKAYDSLGFNVGHIGEFVENYGLESLFSHIASTKEKMSKQSETVSQADIADRILTQVCWYNKAHECDRNVTKDKDKLVNHLSWLPVDLEETISQLPLKKGRSFLKRIFRHTGPWDFLRQFNPWEGYSRYFKIGKGALPILQALPRLASEKFHCSAGKKGETCFWYPYFILLFSGMIVPKKELKKVQSYYTIPLQEKMSAVLYLLSINQQFHLNPNPRRPNTIPRYILETMLELDPDMIAQPKDRKKLLETLFRFGCCPKLKEPARLENFQIQAQGLSCHGFMPCTMSRWEANWLKETILPDVQHLECIPANWDDEGLLTLVPAITASVKLQSLTLAVPTDLIHEIQAKLLPACQQLLLEKPKSLDMLHLKAEDNDGEAELAFQQGIANTLQKIKENPGGWSLSELRLSLMNEIGLALFLPALDMFTAVEIRLEWSYGHNSRETKMLTKDTPVGLLSICCLNSPGKWKEIWAAIAKLKRAKSILFRPDAYSLDYHLQTVLSSVSTMPLLQELQLAGPSGGFDTMDCTAPFCALLDQTPLQLLHVVGIDERAESYGPEVPSYKVRARRLCEALKSNTTLQSLRLLHVSLEGETCSVAKLFLEVMEEGNTTVRDLALCSEKVYYTALHGSVWRDSNRCRRYTYDNYEAAQKLQYLTSLNSAGHGKAKGSSLGELVQLFGRVGVSTESKQSIGREIVQYVSSAGGVSVTDSTSDVYDMLQKAPGQWSDGQDAQDISILYDLLSESIASWCPAAGWVTTGTLRDDGQSSPPKKRQRQG